MPKEQTDLAVRKKMRKGTHSCFECRRRKIRCIYPSDNPSVCSECFARGSRCIDQENASPDVIVDHRKNLRERVSRLEALVDSLLEDKVEESQTSTSSSKTPNLVHRDTFPPTPLSSEASSAVLPNPQLNPPPRAASDRGHHIPIISAFEDCLQNAEGMYKAQMEATAPTCSANMSDGLLSCTGKEARLTVTCENADDMMGVNSARFKAKRERAKQGLIATLPPLDQVQRIFASNGDWWRTWRRKCSGTSDSEQSLTDFASKALADGNIGAIGTAVLSVGICSADEDDVEKYIEAVDRFVLCDDEYAATLEGMECLILKSKWYADVGQPRRAWISYRKGLMYAQLMGLHRQRTSSAAHESIWWSLYHGDRFLSLLLGLPYGILDSHCDLTLPDMDNGRYLAPLVFMNKIAILAGKVIDRNQILAEQSFAWALQLDQELEDLWKQLDPAWLEYSQLMVDIEKNAAELRERLMAQMMYHQIRVYLHLPFMLKSQSNPRFSFSRNACLNGSRAVLRLYQALRTGEVQPLYECKAIDFIGFTAAVLIVLGLYNFGGPLGGMAPKDQEEDTRLIEISIDIFRRASSEKGGKVALQSAEVLERMLKKFKSDWSTGPNEAGCDMSTDFVIPYFGTISIRRGPHKVAPPSFKKPALNTSPSQLNLPTRKPSASTSTTSPSQITPSSETTGSDLFGNPHHLAGGGPGSTTSGSLFAEPFISYDGFYNWPAAQTDTPTPTTANPANLSNSNNPAAPAVSSATNNTTGAHVNDDSMANFPLPTNNFSWQNMPMDIDQDWSWFLNDASMVSTAGAGQQQQQQQGGGNVGDAFSQQTYAGFG